jgi:hypothetical protein
MKLLLTASLLAAALTAATPASAALTLVSGGACNITTPNPDAIRCSGAYEGNLNNNNRIGDLNAAVDVLMGGDYANFTWSAVEGTKDFFEATGQTLMFDTVLYGAQIFSFHFGNAGTGNGDYTVLYLFDFGTTGASSINVGVNGFSNGVIVPPPVPEPGTWAMMLLGFGGIGMAMRRRRRSSTALPQLA